jgi:hypothetical protein
MRIAEFVPFWSKGKDSFLSDPPNADISILEGGPLRQKVMVLQDPTLQGDNLTYAVRVLQARCRSRDPSVGVYRARSSSGGISSKLRGPLHHNLTSGLPFILAMEKRNPLLSGSFSEMTGP